MFLAILSMYSFFGIITGLSAWREISSMPQADFFERFPHAAAQRRRARNIGIGITCFLVALTWPYVFIRWLEK